MQTPPRPLPTIDPSILVAAYLGFALSVAVACRGDGADTGAEQECVPGRVQACPCLGDRRGRQTCQPDGVFGACECKTTDAAGPDGAADTAPPDTRDRDTAVEPPDGAADTGLDTDSRDTLDASDADVASPDDTTADTAPPTDSRDPAGSETGAIQPYANNRFYWQYDGEPVLLVGGSNNDKLFHYTGSDLENRLDTIANAEGNYVRNVMHLKVAGSPFEQKSDGRYDLDKWNSDYWNRLRNFLNETEKREIFVQITFWGAHEYNDDGEWNKNPFHPDKNVNYDADETSLELSRPDDIDLNDLQILQTVPALNDDEKVLKYQEKFVRKLLDVAMDYDHVLYNLNNEDKMDLAWGKYWADFAKNYADNKGESIYLTNMRYDRFVKFDHHSDVKRDRNEENLKNTDYDYIDISQNTLLIATKGEEHVYQNILFNRDKVDQLRGPMPINNVKVYGSGDETLGAETDRGALTMWWINIFAGSASTRFHRPPWGLGIGQKAQQALRSVHMVTRSLDDFFEMRPMPGHLKKRADGEAFLLGDSGDEYAVFFTGNGNVDLDLTNHASAWKVRWLDTRTGSWERTDSEDGTVKLQTPGSDKLWIAVVTKMTN